MEANKVTVIARVIQILLTISLLSLGWGIVGTAIAYLVYGLIIRVLGKYYFYHYHQIDEHLRMVEEKPTKKEIQDTFHVVWHNASREGVVTLANYLANQACTIICPLYTSLSDTGVYSLAVQLATVLANVAGGLYTANQPVLQSAYITNDKEKMKKTMSLIVTSFLILYMLGFIAIIVLALPILKLIKPSSTPSILIMSLAAIYQFILKFRNCYTSYFSCTNRVIYAKAFISSSLLCVVLAILFLDIGNLGLYGLFAAQIISQLIWNAWYWPKKAHQEMELSFHDTLTNGFVEFKHLVSSLLGGARS